LRFGVVHARHGLSDVGVIEGGVSHRKLPAIHHDVVASNITVIEGYSRV